jgi:hypothetical protein
MLEYLQIYSLHIKESCIAVPAMWQLQTGTVHVQKNQDHLELNYLVTVGVN